MAKDTNINTFDNEEPSPIESQFKWLYDNDPIMHFSVDASSERIIKCNQTAVNILGYTSKDEIIGRLIQELYTREAVSKIPQHLETFRTTGKLENVELEMKAKDGRPISIMLNSNAIRDENGNVIASQSACTDITKLKSAERLLIEQKKKLQTINRDLERFVSICTHDLKEPLATIKFSGDVLQKVHGHLLNAKANSYLTYIQEAADRLAEQITDLAEHAKLGKNVKRECVDIKELVAIVKYDLAKQISERKAVIKTQGLPKIRVYRTEFRLLIQNLISNAIRYARAGQIPKILVKAERRKDLRGDWLFSVSDNGIGIDMEDQEKIFQIFNRLVHKSHSNGSGVGLAHCEKIVELHEGNIWVESAVDEGSVFFFTIKDDISVS